MNKKLLIVICLLLLNSFAIGQKHFIEFGLGSKYDVFKIEQPAQVFDQNFDIGALAFISYSRMINNKLGWEAGIATNNYKLNFSITSDNDIIFSNRELVSVMRSNRLFLNILHHTREINSRLSWTNHFGISMLIGAKNPYDVILQRNKEIETTGGGESVDLRIKTFGPSGSTILIGAGSRLYYSLNKGFKLVGCLGFVFGTSQLSKVEVDYLFNSNTTYQKAIFTTNGFAPSFTFGAQYGFGEK